MKSHKISTVNVPGIYLTPDDAKAFHQLIEAGRKWRDDTTEDLMLATDIVNAIDAFDAYFFPYDFMNQVGLGKEIQARREFPK